MRYDLELEGRLHRVTGPLVASEVEAFVDQVVAELERLDAEDIDVSTDLETADVRVAISVEADELPTAQVTGGGAIRTAFHAAGAATPGWRVDWVRSTTVPELIGN